MRERTTQRTTIATSLLLFFVLIISVFAVMEQDEGARRGVASFDVAAPVNISNSSSDSGNPVLALDGAGAAYLVWLEYPTGENKRYYFSTNKSGKWATPQLVERIVYNVEESGFASLAVSSSGIGHLTFQDGRVTSYDIFYLKYENGWSAVANLSDNDGGSAYSGCAASPADNYAYVAWQDGTGRDWGWDILWRYRSPAGSWSSTQILPIGGGYMPQVAVDAAGTAHLAWTTSWGRTVWFSRNRTPRDSSGWTQPVLIKGDAAEDWSEARVACDNAGNAYVVWMDGNRGNDEIFIRKVNSGGTLSEEVNVSQTSGASQQGAVAVQKETGKVCVAWVENGDIFLNTYTGTWTGPTNLTNTADSSTMPSIAVDSSGYVHLAYAERTGGNWEILYTTTSQGPPPSTTSSTSTIGSTTTTSPSTSTTSSIASTTTTSSTTSTTTTSTSTTTSTTSTTTTTSIPVQPKPPLDLSLGTRLDATQTKKINTLSWEGNPENNSIDLENYRIYRKRANMPDGDFVLIAAVLTNVFRYEDINLSLIQKYTYGMTAVPRDPHGLESTGSEFVTEISVFAPLDAACKTVTNSSLFRSEKINVISWKKNPLNEAITVLQYNIYRKKADQDDTQYRRIASAGGNVFEYQDRKLSFSDKFHYVITAVDTGGNESIASNSARESS